MSVYWFQLQPAPTQRNVVILDVSQAAEGFRPILLSVLEGLAEEIPAAWQPEVAFLGGAKRYPLAAFLRHADDLFSRNAGRGRVIAPTLESLPRPWPVRLTVFAARPIFDLEDWLQPPYQHHLAIVALDPTVAIAGGDRDQSLNAFDMPMLARLVNPEPQQIQMQVASGLPVSWPEPNWRLEQGTLVHAGPLTAPAQLGWCVPDERETVEPRVEMTWEGGLITRLKPRAIDISTPQEWRPLTGSELTRLDAWRMRRPAACPHCQQEHPPGQVLCAHGESGFLPTLAGVPPGIVRLRIKTFQASVLPIAEQIFVQTDTVAWGKNTEGQMVRWEYDPAQQSWVMGRPLSPFERIAPDEHLLVLPRVKPAEGGRP